MAQTASTHVNELVISALVNGTTDTCYDGTAFFGNTHTARGDGAAFDNLAAGTATTTAGLATDLATVKSTMLRFQDETGASFHNDSPAQFTVVAPPELEKNLREVLGATMISNTSNMQVGAAQLIISPRLADANDWYFLRTDNLARGLLFQQRSPIEFSALESNTESSFLREVYYYGVRARYAVGYAFPQCAIKVVNS
jgi:phage major head subunit gpT-like protein